MIARSMLRRFVYSLACAGWLGAAGCIDTLGGRVEIPFSVAGSDVSMPFPGQAAWTLELSRAELAFGPLYLCGGYQAGSLCETARVEWLGSAVVDALDPEPQAAGALEGVTGPVRSWMYDLGITSLLTLQQPKPLDAALALGGYSLHLEGVAHGSLDVPFVFDLAIEQQEQTEIGVPVVRKSGADQFAHDVTGNEAGLVVRFDPRPWLGAVDFDTLAQDAAATAQAYRALNGAIVAGARPAFEWSEME